MNAPKKKDTTEPKKSLPPPSRTVEGRENQLIQAAVDLAEKQLSNGTASSQVITHYLKLGSTKERLEKEKLARENELLRAKTEALQSAKRIEDLYANALNAMRAYGGTKEEDSVDDVED